MTTRPRIDRFLDVIENDIAPMTAAGVEKGDKIFGAAILRRDDLSLVVAETNNETENPLWHGEIHAIKRFYELPAASRPEIGDCLMIATHEPCSLCLSGVAWGGLPEFAYLFSHQDSADSFAIPYDIQILQAVYAVPDPDRDAPAPGRDLYNRQNAFFSSENVMTAIRAEADPALDARVASLAALYAGFSDTYQASKGAAGIPHA